MFDLILNYKSSAWKKIRYVAKLVWIQVKFNMVSCNSILFDQLQKKYNVTELPAMPGKVAIVTGANRGMGAEVVRMLLQCDMKVIVACRNMSAGQKAIEEIRESGVQTGTARILELDNSSLKSVRNFVEIFKSNYTKLDVLINNAGVMFIPYKRTVDGFEQQYQVNYLSHFYLTISLIPHLKETGTIDHNSRIINVSSCGHLVGKIDFTNFNNYEEHYDTGAAYAQSKLAQVVSTRYLAKFLREIGLPVTVHAVHPGIVNTELFFHENTYLRHLKFMSNFLLKTPSEGAVPIVYAAMSPRIESKTGLYISNCLEAPVNSVADDEATQQRLVECSLKQVRLESI